jgi:predicted Zn-dependent protease
MKRTALSGSVWRGWVMVFALALTAGFLRAQSNPDEPQDNDQSPYHQALLNYKSGKYEAARVFIDNAAKAQPDSVPVALLKVRILTEQHEFKQAMHVLENVTANPALTPADGQAITLAYADLELRQHHFAEASKYYESLLLQKSDTDLTLKLIYARIGAGDLVEAGKRASELKPLDAANPAYYFGRAALAKATGQSSEEEQDIEQARTVYGMTMTNRYLKTYLEVFAPDKNSISATLNPPVPATNAAPATNPAPSDNTVP